MAPGSRIGVEVADRIQHLAAQSFPSKAIDLHFHPQCFDSCGHFAGDDAQRTSAFLEIANDAAFDAVWFARGGYGACRLVEALLPQLAPAARTKAYLGYSDGGVLLAALYKLGFTNVAHGPMAIDITRSGGEAAVRRALSYLVDGSAEAIEPSVVADTPTAAFNITILSHLIGTPYMPDLSGHLVMLEEISEHLYRIDRDLFHITSNAAFRKVAGIRLGRCDDIPDNDPDFGQTEDEIAQHWCDVSGIAYLGRADIGHDVDNKVVPFGYAPSR